MLAPRLFNDSFDLFDRFYQDPWFGFQNNGFKYPEKKLYGSRTENVMRTDITESDSGYEMTIELPGFKKEDVSVALEKGYLTIGASRTYGNDGNEDKDRQKAGNYIRKERYSGSCSRSFYVGDALRVEDVKARFDQGILTLTIPKADSKAVAENKYIAIEG